ncbi:MAG: glycosyltransferase family 2 protein [Caldilinea sp. CFX5]|nr:glycosyltransferase family 2 protein [Caldilinea sp. CFX5]
MQPKVVTIILNNNRCQDTVECLLSLAQSTYTNQTLVILDNGSTDGSVATIRTTFPATEVVELTENLGYAGNNNIGINIALTRKADWIFILNDDTIVDADCLHQLIQVGESDPHVGMLGPMVYHYKQPYVIQSGGGLLSRYWESLHVAKDEPDRGQLDQPHRVDWISGCALLVRRAVIEQIGLLDEDFFCYWEETEWCMRATKAGWHLIHVPQAKIWHKGTPLDAQPKPMMIYYLTRNHLLLLAKHHAPLRIWLQIWIQLLRTLTSWTIKPKWRHMRAHRNAMWQGIIDFLCRRWGPLSLKVNLE